MRFGVLGTGIVGRTLAGKLLELGHDVRMGARSADNESAAAFAADGGERASHGTFEEAAAFGDMVLNCTAGIASLDALRAAGADNLAGKILIDVANPLDFSKGMPPTLTVCNTDSLGEQIQREFPDSRVVKVFNTVNSRVMVDPDLVAGPHDLFLCGNDESAKTEVRRLIADFGWDSFVDLGDITAARATEMLLPFWLRLWGYMETTDFNLRVVGPAE